MLGEKHRLRRSRFLCSSNQCFLFLSTLSNSSNMFSVFVPFYIWSVFDKADPVLYFFSH